LRNGSQEDLKMTDSVNLVPPAPDESTPVESAAASEKLDAQANAIIGAAVAATAGMGWIPAFIDTGWLVAANSGMVMALAVTYRYKWTGDHVKSFIERLVGDAGLSLVSVKALCAFLDLTGIGLPAGIAINGAVNAALTLAIGKSAQHYFKSQGAVPDDELVKFFRQSLDLRKVLGRAG
jgi:uncharacterized protein (DUF697 family)